MHNGQKRAWFTGAHLKWMAILIMLLDHTAVVFYEPLVQCTTMERGYDVYIALRCIGRTAFPIFCFLLTEGYFHTRNKARYVRNLVLFALISELPFDLALYDSLCYTQHQNVFFTLAIGLMCIWAADTCKAYLIQRKDAPSLISCAKILIAVCGAALAAGFRTDYGAMGVVVIMTLYEFHARPMKGAFSVWILLGLSSTLEFFSFPFLPAVYFYNGERGRQHKFFFYIFYPAHLLLLAWLRKDIPL